jgi:hypothetical protein
VFVLQIFGAEQGIYFAWSRESFAPRREFYASHHRNSIRRELSLSIPEIGSPAQLGKSGYLIKFTIADL